MPLTNEELKIIVPELNAAYLHLSRASELLSFYYHDLRKSGEVPAMTAVGEIVKQLEVMRRALRLSGDESILSRFLVVNTNLEPSDIDDAARKRCREMFMRLTERTQTRKTSAQTEATSAPKKKSKSLVKSKKLLRLETGKSKPKDKA